MSVCVHALNTGYCPVPEQMLLMTHIGLPSETNDFSLKAQENTLNEMKEEIQASPEEEKFDHEIHCLKKNFS